MWAREAILGFEVESEMKTMKTVFYDSKTILDTLIM